jgi:hypothetical protein
MKTVIVCWKDHHLGLPPIKNLKDLYNLIFNGFLWTKEKEDRDEKVTITIETEE